MSITRLTTTLGLAAAILAGTAFEAAADVSVTLKRANQQIKNEKPAGRATGSQALVDASGLEYFINTDITFSTTSSASGAASEASYTGPVNADTSGGGTTLSTLNDAFDGYGTLCVSTDGSTGICATGGPSYTVFNQNGPATLDATCGNRQVIYNPQTIGGLTVQRKVYVPSDDEFLRFLELVTNNGGVPVTINLITSNNLGSDSNTTIVTTDSGDAVATTADRWVTTFQNFSGTTSSDPRIGHVLFGAGGAVGLTSVNFADGDDNPFWAYTLTLQPGETRAVIWFVTGQPTRADAAAKAAELADFGANAQGCLSPTELAEISNFVAAGPAVPVVEVPTTSTYGLIGLALLLTLGALVLFRRS